MKILITGANGQLGSILKNRLAKQNQVFAFSSSELDITNKEKISSILRIVSPEIVINCASYNKVDQAENDKEVARAINTEAVSHLATSCNELGIKLIHFSTDFVFDGIKGEMYIERDLTNPLNYYGITKCEGEKEVLSNCKNSLVIRTSWLYGIGNNNFVSTIQKMAKKYTQLRVINDQIGSPTNAFELAEVVLLLIQEDLTGLFHCSGNGICSWYEFAKTIIRYAEVQCDIIPVSTKEYGQVAVRPNFSVLDNKHLRETIGDPMLIWQDSLEKYFKSK